MESTTAVISFVCLFALFQSCNSIKCYSCLSTRDDNCDIITNDRYLKDCTNYDACYLIIRSYRTSYTKTIKYTDRGCEPRGIKYVMKTCSTDKCNGNDGIVSNNYISGNRIKCYDCDSVTNSEFYAKCGKIVDDKYLKDCNSGEVCNKFEILNSDNTTNVWLRSCVPDGYKLDSQMHCNTDKCNGL